MGGGRERLTFILPGGLRLLALTEANVACLQLAFCGSLVHLAQGLQGSIALTG